jgi:hypothetical protein
MERYLRKSVADGLEQGFDPDTMTEPAVSAARHGPQRAEGPQPSCYTLHWVYAKPNAEGQNGNSG